MGLSANAISADFSYFRIAVFLMIKDVPEWITSSSHLHN